MGPIPASVPPPAVTAESAGKLRTATQQTRGGALWPTPERQTYLLPVSLVTHTFNNVPFVFREDGWFNMTKAAQHFGKKLSHFWIASETDEYIKELGRIHGNSPESGQFVSSTPGRNGGTWAHPKLAVFFARWLDVKFAVWCGAMIEDILKGKAEVVVTKPAESAVMAE